MIAEFLDASHSNCCPLDPTVPTTQESQGVSSAEHRLREWLESRPRVSGAGGSEGSSLGVPTWHPWDHFWIYPGYPGPFPVSSRAGAAGAAADRAPLLSVSRNGQIPWMPLLILLFPHSHHHIPALRAAPGPAPSPAAFAGLTPGMGPVGTPFPSLPTQNSYGAPYPGAPAAERALWIHFLGNCIENSVTPGLGQ